MRQECQKSKRAPHLNALLKMGILGIGTQRLLLLVGLALAVGHG
jgi:hypothetical protein